VLPGHPGKAPHTPACPLGHLARAPPLQAAAAAAAAAAAMLLLLLLLHRLPPLFSARGCEKRPSSGQSSPWSLTAGGAAPQVMNGDGIQGLSRKELQNALCRPPIEVMKLESFLGALVIAKLDDAWLEDFVHYHVRTHYPLSAAASHTSSIAVLAVQHMHACCLVGMHACWFSG
jgi:hypothetical protein